MTNGGPRRAVAIGGGTGLPTVLRCFVSLGFETCAVVTMADDGGSTGMLRRELGMLPPGDIRNCLVALGDRDGALGRLFQYRFPHGEGLAGHALGNLIIAALADITGSFPAAIEEAGRLLGVQGRVVPSTLEDVRLHGEDAHGEPVFGQANIAASRGPVARVAMDPPSPRANPAALAAIREADVVCVGPGSLFTSIIPNLLVHGIADALRSCRGIRIYVCNVANQRGETVGMDAADHVGALLEHGGADAIDLVVVHDSDTYPAPDVVCDDERVEPVDGSAVVLERIQAMGLGVLSGDLIDAAQPLHHDCGKLCRILEEAL